MIKSFITKQTGREELYRAKNFVSYVDEFFPNAYIFASGETRLKSNGEERIGQRIYAIRIPETDTSTEAIIYVRERIYDLPKKKKRGKNGDDWGKEIRAFTWIEIEETSGSGYKKEGLESILRGEEFIEGFSFSTETL